MKSKFFNNINFITSSLSISVNFFFSTILLTLLSFAGFLDLAAEIGITVSFTLFFCQIFSANHRSLIYLNTFDLEINKIIQFRIFISLVIAIASIVIIIFLEFENMFFLSLLSILICTQWTTEIILTKKEKNNQTYILNNLLLFNIFYIIIFILLILLNFLHLINYLMITIIITYLLTYRKEMSFKKINKFNFKLIFDVIKISVKNLEIISSFSINFANLIWRLSILFLAGKSVAGLLFGSYALGSFFGTIYSNIFAPKIHSKKKLFPKKLILFSIPLVMAIFYYGLVTFENFENLTNYNSSRISCILFSLTGSFFMIISLMMRFNYFFNVDAKLVFKIDIFYSILISSTIVIIFMTLGLKYFVFAYFFASICSLAIYSLPYIR
tara:strand:- start:45 stop:1196 length:1152 start_codon:yes stop_codon:yes gene_type:complete